ncbi:MAG TPA: hypothetical protein VG407_01955 [Caulobacteraceae bacterium]|nr:hypothetical protein [Caulobacteraceae bacterium]
MAIRFAVILVALASLAFGPAESAGRLVKITFVDTGNTGRSVAAEAIANDLIHSRGAPIAVASRAVDMDPLDRLPEPNVVKLLALRGIDVSAHRAEPLTAKDVADADLILTMTVRHRIEVIRQFPKAEPKTFTLSEFATGEARDVEDAKDHPMGAYKRMLEQVAGLVPGALSKASGFLPKCLRKKKDGGCDRD